MVSSLSQGLKSEAEVYYLKAIQLDPTKGNCYMHYGENTAVFTREHNHQQPSSHVNTASV